MPELPEVETIKNYLRKLLIGKTILGFKNFDKKRIQIKSNDIIGEKISDITRKGKILIIQLTNNKRIFIHLKMTGQLIYTPNREISKFTRAIFELSSNRKLMRTFPRTHTHIILGLKLMRTPHRPTQTYANYIHDHLHYLIFNDVRRFGWMKLNAKEINKLGVEPFTKKFNLQNLQKIFKATKRPIKIVLMDQAKIAGIGNIYASESLFLARINPLKPANKLTKEEIKNLRNSILRVFKKAIKYEGTSSSSYIKPDKSKGKYQENFLVYKREGDSCFRCKSKIKRIILAGRSTFYCPSCQK